MLESGKSLLICWGVSYLLPLVWIGLFLPAKCALVDETIPRVPTRYVAHAICTIVKARFRNRLFISLVHDVSIISAANLWNLWLHFIWNSGKILDETILEFCRARRFCRPGSSGSTVNWRNFSSIRVINKQSSQIFTEIIENIHYRHFLWHLVSNSTRDILVLSADAESRIYNKNLWTWSFCKISAGF